MKAGARDLRAPVGRTACVVALRHLAAARAAALRLNDDTDAEALHDLRVALRRLRSALRAHRPYLADRVPRGLRRRLRGLARATNAARDADVQIAWLAHASDRFPAAERAAGAWWRGRLEREQAAAYDDIRARLAGGFGKLDQRLRVALAPDVAAGGGPGVTFARATGERVLEYVAALADELAAIDSADAYGAIHAARVAGKRLRYLIEPVAREVPAAVRSVEQLKRLQDSLGAVCDAHVRRRALGQALAAATSERSVSGREPDPRSGLLALARRVEAEIAQLYDRMARAYLQGRTERFLAPFTALGRRLARPARPMRALNSKRAMSMRTSRMSHPSSRRRRR